MKLSLVVPAYRQAASIYQDVQNIRRVLDGLDMEYEVIVVVDGHVDDTYEAALPLRHDGVIVLGYQQNQGKGHAVRHGMSAASGDIVGFLDAGGDLDPEYVKLAVRQLVEHDADIVVGSKRHPESEVHYPTLRRLYSAGYQSLTWLLFGFNVRDTQVGLKIFRREVVEDILPLLLVKRFAFDVELLAVARMLGYSKFEESPIRLNLVFPSSIGGLKTINKMLWDTAAVCYRMNILRYYQRLANEQAALERARRIVASTTL